MKKCIRGFLYSALPIFCILLAGCLETTAAHANAHPYSIQFTAQTEPHNPNVVNFLLGTTGISAESLVWSVEKADLFLSEEWTSVYSQKLGNQVSFTFAYRRASTRELHAIVLPQGSGVYRFYVSDHLAHTSNSVYVHVDGQSNASVVPFPNAIQVPDGSLEAIEKSSESDSKLDIFSDPLLSNAAPGVLTAQRLSA